MVNVALCGAHVIVFAFINGVSVCARAGRRLRVVRDRRELRVVHVGGPGRIAKNDPDRVAATTAAGCCATDRQTAARQGRRGSGGQRRRRSEGPVGNQAGAGQQRRRCGWPVIVVRGRRSGAVERERRAHRLPAAARVSGVVGRRRKWRRRRRPVARRRETRPRDCEILQGVRHIVQLSVHVHRAQEILLP